MVRTIRYAMNVQNSIFLSFLKNEKTIFSFLILLMFLVIIFFDTFVFWYIHRKTNRDSKLIYKFYHFFTWWCPLEISKWYLFKVTASTRRKVEISNRLVITEICDPLVWITASIIMLISYFQNIINYCLRVDSKSGK